MKSLLPHLGLIILGPHRLLQLCEGSSGNKHYSNLGEMLIEQTLCAGFVRRFWCHLFLEQC
jgi:hypothetical protein